MIIEQAVSEKEIKQYKGILYCLQIFTIRNNQLLVFQQLICFFLGGHLCRRDEQQCEKLSVSCGRSRCHSDTGNF